MPFPFRVLDSDYAIYTMDTQTTGAQFYKVDRYPVLVFSTILDARVNEKTGRYAPAHLLANPQLRDAMQFTRTYIARDIARAVENALSGNDELGDVGHTIATLFSAKRSRPESAEALAVALETNYAFTGDTGKKERRQLIDAMIEARMQRAVEHYASRGSDRHISNVEKQQAKDAGPGAVFGMLRTMIREQDNSKEKAVAATFKHMPEWLQILTHDTGALVMFNDKPEADKVAGSSMLSDNMCMPWIYLNEQLFLRKATPLMQRERDLVLRE